MLRKRLHMLQDKPSERISVGDLIHYCPADMTNDKHDIGIVYEICEQYFDQYNRRCKSFKILWSKSKLYDVWSEYTINYKLRQKIYRKNMMVIIKQNER